MPSPPHVTQLPVRIMDRGGEQGASSTAAEWRKTIGELYSAHREEMTVVAYGFVGSLADAEDIVQEVFRRILAGGPRPEVRFRYLRTAVVNMAKDYRRDRATRLTAAAGWSRDKALPPKNPFGMHDPEREMWRQRLAAAVHQALADLPEDQAAAVRLVALEGYGHQDAAAILEISQAALKKRLTRGRAKIKVLLATHDLLAVDDTGSFSD